MRFNIPNKKIMNTLIKLTKRLYAENYYDFILKHKQHIFYINNNEDVNSVVVVNALQHQIDIFYDFSSFLTCQYLFSGDENGLASNGFSSLTIEEINIDDVTYSGLEKMLKTIKLFKYEDKNICYLSTKIGQKEVVINEKEAILLISILEYLLHIKYIYDSKEEIMDISEECVTVFLFDEANMTYDCTYVALDSFDFMPKIEPKKTANKELLSKLKKVEITPGTLYIGKYFCDFPYEIFRYENKIEQVLSPTVLYALSDSGIMDYEIYSTLEKNNNKVTTELLEKLLNRVGLFDTIVTNNLSIYLALAKTFKAINIEFKYDSLNAYHNFVNRTLKAALTFDADIEVISEVLLQIKFNYPLLFTDIAHIKDAEVFEEEDSLDELMETDLVDTKKIC